MEMRSESNVTIEKSEIFEILKNDRRRHILEILKKQGSQSVHYLSEEIACLEAGIEEPTDNAIKKIYNSLTQIHIPKMESFNVITYDRDSSIVKLLPAAFNFNTYMETVNKGDVSWSHFFFGISALFLVLSIMIYAGLFKWVTCSQWMLFTSIVFLISSITYARNSHKL